MSLARRVSYNTAAQVAGRLLAAAASVGVLRMSTRYLGENGPKYLAPTMDKPRWLYRLVPVSMQTWQGQDWARRYK